MVSSFTFVQVTGRLGFMSLCAFLVVCSWVSYLISLNTSFPICQVEILANNSYPVSILVLTWNNTGGVFDIVLSNSKL